MTEEVVPVAATGGSRAGRPGLWSDDHTEAWAKVAARLHETGSPPGAAPHPRRPPGRHVPRGRGLDRPLPAGGWRLWAPAALPYSQPVPPPGGRWTPPPGTTVLAAYGDAAGRAAEAGVDVLLLDMADGYLLASFLSPLTNPGDDGDRGSRRYPARGAGRGAGGLAGRPAAGRAPRGRRPVCRAG